jgi:chromosome segregation ATPase
MKTAIKSLLGAIGLAPAGLVERLTDESQRAAGKVTQLEERLAQLRAETDTWKRRHEDTADAVAGWKQAASRAQDDADRAKTEIERLKADIVRARADAEREHGKTDEWKSRTEKMTAEAEDLRARLHNARARLEETQRTAIFAREHLMAIEVKLDLIEAAIQVLDTRTREQAVSRA